MSYTQAEVEILKECVKQLLDEIYFSTVHELKKKLVASAAKQQELESRLSTYKEAIEKIRECHQCHTLTLEFRDAFTQTKEEDFIEEADQDSRRQGRADDSVDLDDSTNASGRPNLGNTTKTSGMSDASTSFQQEPAMQPKMEIQDPNDVAGPSRPKDNNVTPTDVEIICISDDE